MAVPRVQKSFNLLERSLARLDDLAKSNNVSRTKMLEEAIAGYPTPQQTAAADAFHTATMANLGRLAEMVNRRKSIMVTIAQRIGELARDKLGVAEWEWFLARLGEYGGAADLTVEAALANMPAGLTERRSLQGATP